MSAFNVVDSDASAILAKHGRQPHPPQPALPARSMAKCAAHFELKSAQPDDKFAQTPSPMAGIPDQPPSLVNDINSAMSWMRNRVVSGSSMAAMVETAEELQANEDAFQGLFDDDPQSCLHPSPARHEGHGALQGTQST